MGFLDDLNGLLLDDESVSRELTTIGVLGGNGNLADSVGSSDVLTSVSDHLLSLERMDLVGSDSLVFLMESVSSSNMVLLDDLVVLNNQLVVIRSNLFLEVNLVGRVSHGVRSALDRVTRVARTRVARLP